MATHSIFPPKSKPRSSTGARSISRPGKRVCATSTARSTGANKSTKLYAKEKAKSIGTGRRKPAGRKAEFREETERDQCQPWGRKRGGGRSQRARTVEIEEQTRAVNQSAGWTM